jgi:hypothetical protein
MNKRRNLLLSLTSGGMEICWIYAWASFTLVAIVGRALPFPQIVAVFLFSAILTRLSRGRGWRIVSLAGIHFVGYVCSVMAVLHGFYYPSYPLLGTEWITSLFTTIRTPVEWFHLILMHIWVGLFWYGGAAFAYRDRNYAAICGRFDIGLAAFFVLFLVKLALRVKGGITPDDQVSLKLIYPYLLLALTAIGMSRVGHEGSRHFLPGHVGAGMFMSGISVVLLFASSLILFLIPCLTKVAEAGQRALKSTALWILPVVAGVIRFIFMGGKIRPDPPLGSSPKGANGSGFSTIAGWWSEALDKILRWGLEIMVVTFSILIAVVLVYLAFQWLSSRTALCPRLTSQRPASRFWLMRLGALLFALWSAVKKVSRGYTKASELYSVLSAWGRHSGIPRIETETPLEFGARLTSQFPTLHGEISSIISAFNIEAYGKTMLTDEQFTDALAAWRIVKKPIHWPRRFKTRFITRVKVEY